MKKVEIRNYNHAEVESPKDTFGYLKIPNEFPHIRAEGENLEVSDGYHTFDELYDHRITLYIALCKELHRNREEVKAEGVMTRYAKTWKSKLHSDGTSFEGWFVLGIGKDEGTQITYHLPMDRWEKVSEIETLEKAPAFDGHSSADVLARLKQL